MEPFRPRRAPEPSRLTRTLLWPDSDSAEAAVFNLFARAESIEDVSRAALGAIAAEYRVGAAGHYRVGLADAGRAVFTKLLAHYVADSVMSDEEVATLIRVKELFDLTSEEARALHDDAAAEHYRRAVDERVADRELSAADRAALERLRNALLLSEERALQEALDGAQAVLRSVEDKLATDLALSPTEVESLRTLAGRLATPWPLDGPDQQRVERLRRQWALDRLPLETAPVPIWLAEDEVGYLSVERVEWLEERKGFAEQIPEGTLAAELVELLQYWFDGIAERINPDRQSSSDRTVAVSLGTLVVTNHRLEYVGTTRRETIPIAGIRELKHDAGRVELRVSSHPWPVILGDNDGLTTAFVLVRRLMHDAASEAH